LSVTVQEARAKVTDSIVHIGATTFSTTKLDRAIIAAVNRFLRETKIVRAKKTISITDGDVTYDLATLVAAGVDLDRVMSVMHIASTDWSKVEIVDYDLVRAWHEDNDREGEPEIVGFDGDNLVVYPTPDANYTLQLQTYQLQDQTGWTIGGTDGTTLAVTLDVPDRWVDDVLWFALGLLLLGAPGHPTRHRRWPSSTASLSPPRRAMALRRLSQSHPTRRTNPLYSQGYNP